MISQTLDTMTEPANIDWPACDALLASFGFHAATVTGALHSWCVSKYELVRCADGEDFERCVEKALRELCAYIQFEACADLTLTQYTDHPRSGYIFYACI